MEPEENIGPITAKPYLDKVPEFPDFAVLNDTVSQRFPVTKVSSWRALSGILTDPFFKQQGTQFIFRGQRRYDWDLAPSLGRFDNGIVREETFKNQLRIFQHAVRGRLADYDLVTDEQSEELWSVGQHHGLATPLIDWTLSPYVALFFAFEGADNQYEKENPCRVIYVLNKSYLEQDDNCPDIRILEPRRDSYGRLVNQAGLFTVAPFDNTTEGTLLNWLLEHELDKEIVETDPTDDDAEPGARILANYVCKIYIPNEERDECLRYLRQMNVHHASLFPDIIGASSYCNILTAEFAANEQAKKDATDVVVIVGKVTDLTKEDDQGENTEIVTLEGPANDVAPLAALPADAVVDLYSQVLDNSGSSYTTQYNRSAAKDLSELFENIAYLDWPNSESKQADLRIQARKILRQWGFLAPAVTAVLEPIMELAKSRYQPPA